MMKSSSELYEFLDSYKLGVIATVDTGNMPCSAIVGFGQTKDLSIIFGTDISSQKFKNMLANPNVSFVIGGQTTETVQLKGTARELKAEELALVETHYWMKNPAARKHHANPGERYFIITPAWLRYTDLRVNPWAITELTF